VTSEDRNFADLTIAPQQWFYALLLHSYYWGSVLT
jgi:hypothetical protein